MLADEQFEAGLGGFEFIALLLERLEALEDFEGLRAAFFDLQAEAVPGTLPPLLEALRVAVAQFRHVFVSLAPFPFA